MPNDNQNEQEVQTPEQTPDNTALANELAQAQEQIKAYQTTLENTQAELEKAQADLKKAKQRGGAKGGVGEITTEGSKEGWNFSYAETDGADYKKEVWLKGLNSGVVMWVSTRTANGCAETVQFIPNGIVQPVDTGGEGVQYSAIGSY